MSYTYFFLLHVLRTSEAPVEVTLVVTVLPLHSLEGSKSDSWTLERNDKNCITERLEYI